MERKCLHNIDLLLEIMLEGNTYTSGITKLNEYTFLPGLMVTEPYKKKHFMLPVCSSVFITAIIYLSAQKLTGTILTISLFILKNNVFKIKVFLLVAVGHNILSFFFMPSYLSLPFGFDRKTLHFDFLADHHYHISREDVPRGEGALFVHLVEFHKEMLDGH